MLQRSGTAGQIFASYSLGVMDTISGQIKGIGSFVSDPIGSVVNGWNSFIENPLVNNPISQMGIGVYNFYSGLATASASGDWNSVAYSLGGATVVAGELAASYAIGKAIKNKLVAKRERIYSPVKRSKLDKGVANTFRGGTYAESILTSDTTFYRVYGNAAKKVGSYMSRTMQNGGLQSQLDLALNPSWGNSAKVVSLVRVPKGTIIFEGFAAAQNIYDSYGNVIGVLPGGGNQVYIPNPCPSWFD